MLIHRALSIARRMSTMSITPVEDAIRLKVPTMRIEQRTCSWLLIRSRKRSNHPYWKSTTIQRCILTTKLCRVAVQEKPISVSSSPQTFSNRRCNLQDIAWSTLYWKRSWTGLAVYMLFSYERGRQQRRKDRPLEKRQSRESQSQTSRKIDNAMLAKRMDESMSKCHDHLPRPWL